MSEIEDVLVEEAAKAIYARIPTFMIVNRVGTDVHGTITPTRIEDTWEEAEDRHEECRDLARAALSVIPRIRDIIAFETEQCARTIDRYIIEDRPADVKTLLALKMAKSIRNRLPK